MDEKDDARTLSQAAKRQQLRGKTEEASSCKKKKLLLLLLARHMSLISLRVYCYLFQLICQLRPTPACQSKHTHREREGERGRVRERESK